MAARSRKPRNEQTPAPEASLAPARPADPGARKARRRPAVLVVGADEAVRDALALAGISHEAAASADEARTALRRRRYDAAVIDLRLPEGDGVALVREWSARAEGPRAIVLARSGSLEDAMDAMRSGARDLIVRPFEGADLATRVRRALDEGRRERTREQEVERLRRACSRMQADRKAVTRQVDSLCNDLADAYEELAEQMSHVSMASEFASLLKQELDVESLLRTCLEFVLTRTGPTNAAIFLPSNHCDYSLGAYVNYDCPKDSAEVLLDHLADVLAPRVDRAERLIEAPDDAGLERLLGADEAHWLAGTGAIAYPCRHEGECLAVLVLFRDRTKVYP
ncbi:MAG: response regulator, partial [Phycisphaerales bacterium]|nr:response regulator [Phycisphaerales bacterium]